MGNMFGGKPKQSAGNFKMTSEAAQGEKALLNQLLAQINGTAPSVADAQYKSAVEDAIKTNQAMGASARGVQNAGLMNRNVMNANAQVQNDMAKNSGILRLQEQQGAQQLMGQQVGAQRGVALQAGIANQQADAAYRQQNMNLIGNLGAAGAVAFSDENLKTNKKKGDALRAVEEFLNSVQPYEYNYKGDDKERLGVMAQDLEKSKIGNQIVKDTPEGKVVDYGQGFSAMMAGLAEMNKRIKKIEKKKA